LNGGAARHATERVPIGRPRDTAGEAREGLNGREFVSVDLVVVLDGERLAGVIPIERLLAAPKRTRLEDIMDSAPEKAAPSTKAEHVAAQMATARLSAMPVVGRDGRFHGVVTATAMLPVLLTEHDEDMARIGGYLASTNRARLAVEEPLARRLWHRMPWLLLGLVGAMLSAVIVGAFEAELDEKVLLAFFVPAVVYMAGAVGSQTVTVLVRGLAVGIKPQDVFWREMLTGLIAGVLVGGAFYPFALLAWGDSAVALAVGLALAATCLISTLVAMLLPWGLQRLGFDPAFGSGPVATIIQDLLSISVYLAIAVPIAT
jgi:magnesium transporter